MSIDVSVVQGIANLKINRPEKRNAFTNEMMHSIVTSVEKLALDTSLRILILKGEGKVFCSGADISGMKERGEGDKRKNRADAELLSKMFHSICSFPVPVLAVVQGAAIGGGMGLAACADEVLVYENALFCTSEVRLGVIPAVISPYLLRKCGSKVAPMMMSGERVSASEAIRIGLADKMISSESEITERIRSYLVGAPIAVRKTKRLILDARPVPDANIRERTIQAIVDARSSDEAMEGLAAFLNKGKPEWQKSD